MIPAAIRNPLVEIPKNLNKNWPQNVNEIKMKKEIIVARLTICRLSDSSNPFVIVKKTGIVPNGFVNVKNEVKHNKAKGMIVSIIQQLLIMDAKIIN